MTGAANDDAVIATGYDAADRPTSFSTTLVGSSATDTVSYGYDAAGRRSSMSYGGVTDAYGYDAAGRLASITSSVAGALSFAYDAAGRRTVLRRPNGVDTSFAYDAGGQVTSIEHARGGAVLDEARYTYDAAGRRTVVRSFVGDHVYGYDAVGRVTSADNPGSLTDEVFAYDELGNRTGGGEQYDGAGRLTSRDGFTYLSDREGRVTSRIASNGDTTEFGWSDDGRLESIALPDGTVQQVKYDPMRRRIVTTDGSGGTLRQTYGLDPNAVAEHSGGDVSRMTFALGYDQPLAMTTAAASVYFQQDALSSVTSLTDSTGTVTGRYGYDTYGQITSHTGQHSPYTYTGRQYNPQADIYDYRARWYEPDTGRFLTQDAVASANQYWYAAGNPLIANDPTGHLPSNLSELAATEGVVDALAGSFVATVAYDVKCGDKATAQGAAKAAVGGLLGSFVGAKLFRAFVRAADNPASVAWDWVFKAPTAVGRGASKVMVLAVAGAISGALGAVIGNGLSDLAVPTSGEAGAGSGVGAASSMGELFSVFSTSIQDSVTAVGGSALVEILSGGADCG